MREVIVTEGKSDQLILEKVLPSTISKRLHFHIGGGSTSALSAARTYAVGKDNKILLVVDADTTDSIELEEKKRSYQNLLNVAANGSETKLVMITPEMETLFFTDKSFIERAFGIHLSDSEFKQLQEQPVYQLFRLKQEKNEMKAAPINKLDLFQYLLKEMDNEVVDKIRATPQIQEIIEYFKE